MEHVSAADFSRDPAGYVQRLKEGQGFVLTENGQPIGRLQPERENVPAGLEALMAAGYATRPVGSLRDLPPLPAGPVSTRLTDALREQRGECLQCNCPHY